MAKRLLSHGTAPQLIISSTAVRAMQTTEQLMPLINAGSDRLLTTDSIYEAPLSALQDAASQLPDSISVAMMVGHNPGMSSLGNFLCSRADLQMPTCAMACFELDIDHWQGIYRDCATMRWYDYPKKG